MKFKILGQYPREGKRWQIGEETARQLEAAGRVEIVDGIVKKAIYPEDEAEKIIYKPFWSHLRAEDVGTAQSGKEILNSIMGGAIGFDTVKPPALIEELIRHLGKNSLVLDAFAGSGTTAHAVINLNAADGGARKFILIEEQAYCTTITAERVKRVGGEFNFARLGEKLFAQDGSINPRVRQEDLAAHIWFTLTGAALPEKISLPLIGIHEGTAIYLLENILTEKIFATLPAHDGQKIIYATACRLGEASLRKKKIIFKHLPTNIFRENF